jgi:hypothetical protein
VKPTISLRKALADPALLGRAGGRHLARLSAEARSIRVLN